MATLVLVRHCKAADRERWEGSDRDRPLVERGAAQAERLARYLAPSEPALVASSPWLRCVQTADPVAAAAGLEVTADSRLGYDAPDLRDWVIESIAIHPGRDLVAISHGDLIPEFLSDAGLLRGFGRFRTGSLYRVRVDGDRLRPPAVYVDRAELRSGA